MSQIWLWLHTPGGVLIILLSLALAAVVWLIAAKQGENETW